MYNSCNTTARALVTMYRAQHHRYDVYLAVFRAGLTI